MGYNVFDEMRTYQYGSVHMVYDEPTGLRGIVAIHDDRLGPSLGGCRFVMYDTEAEAIVDALRLARGMTSKAALAGIPHGGGKSVIIKPEGDVDRTELFLAFGRFIDTLGGRYITAEDSGTTIDDMETMLTVTKHVTGVTVEHGGSGDPSPFTALGVRRGIEAAASLVLQRSSLEGLVVAVQGVGAVGYNLCRELHSLGAELLVADIDETKTGKARDEFGAEVVSLDGIYSVACDVFAPCALGGAVNDVSIEQLSAKIVAGAANNQLSEPRHGQMLLERGITYVPDYAINSGGLINVAQEVIGYDRDAATKRVLEIYETIVQILEQASAAETPPTLVADRLTEAALSRAG